MIERQLEGRALAAERVRTAARDPAIAAPIAVAVLIVIAAVARILMNRHVLAPWAMEDELQYSDLAKSFAADGHYLFRDQPRNILSIYPALISPEHFPGFFQSMVGLNDLTTIVKLPVMPTLSELPSAF